MSVIEEIVRPFQRPSVIASGQRIPVVVVKVTGGIAEISWGEAGALPQPQDTGTNFALCNEQMNETDRTTDTINIYNPNDSSQFIVVKRAKTMTFDKTDKKAPVLNSDFNVGTEQDLSQFSTGSDGFGIDDGSTTDHCKLTVNLNNNTTQG